MFNKKFFYIILIVFVIALSGSYNFSRVAAGQEDTGSVSLEESYPEETKTDEVKGGEVQKFVFDLSISEFINENAEKELDFSFLGQIYHLRYDHSWEHPLFPWVVINEYLTDDYKTFSFFDQTGEIMSASTQSRDRKDIGNKIDESAADRAARQIMEQYIKDESAYRVTSMDFNESSEFYHITYMRYVDDILIGDFVFVNLEKDGACINFSFIPSVGADIDINKYAEKFKQDDLYLQKLADFTRAEHGDEFVSLNVEDKYLSRSTSGEVIVVYKIGIQLKSGEYCDRGDPGIYYFVLDDF